MFQPVLFSNAFQRWINLIGPAVRLFTCPTVERSDWLIFPRFRLLDLWFRNSTTDLATVGNQKWCWQDSWCYYRPVSVSPRAGTIRESAKRVKSSWKRSIGSVRAGANNGPRSLTILVYLSSGLGQNREIEFCRRRYQLGGAQTTIVCH